MELEPIPEFDCLEFKWKVQSELYEETKDMTVDEQIAFYRKAVESGPFAHLFRTAQTTKPNLPSNKQALLDT